MHAECKYSPSITCWQHALVSKTRRRVKRVLTKRRPSKRRFHLYTHVEIRRRLPSEFRVDGECGLSREIVCENIARDVAYVVGSKVSGISRLRGRAGQRLRRRMRSFADRLRYPNHLCTARRTDKDFQSVRTEHLRAGRWRGEHFKDTQLT